ncbi:hypothetical protein SAMN00808754_1443 [Thermanaeromonas toyohensis ToBE]|uniref:Uncharacterized protein n=1 Tax=Thermanaeromonas toyohensis ToBE TaxID=698762 RepID=A0A1W1VT60_9FIRM|nr:hypothetical protein SAMN00808754_1443 [Thermanaeromonas toyohensis ToBE]
MKSPRSVKTKIVVAWIASVIFIVALALTIENTPVSPIVAHCLFYGFGLFSGAVFLRLTRHGTGPFDTEEGG